MPYIGADLKTTTKDHPDQSSRGNLQSSDSLNKARTRWLDAYGILQPRVKVLIEQPGRDA